MPPHINERFEFRDSLKRKGLCLLQVWQIRSRSIALATELLEENPGSSITNTAEYVAWQVCRFLEIQPAQLVYIEHYPQRGDSPTQQESFHLVTFAELPPRFAHTEPRWQPLTKAEVEALIEEPLP